jgi:hypothetical protein
MAVTKFEPGKYYAHPSKEHSGNWCDSMDIVLDGQPRKCIESCNSTRKNSAYNTTEQSMQIEGHRIKHAFPLDEFIEVPDWNPDEWEFIGNAEQAAGRKIEEGDESSNGREWAEIQGCNGIEIIKYIEEGLYFPVRRRKVAAPQVDRECKNCRWGNGKAGRESACSNPDVCRVPHMSWEPRAEAPPSGRIVNIEDAPIGARVRIVELVDGDMTRAKKGYEGIIIKKDYKLSPSKFCVQLGSDGIGTPIINHGAKVELLDEPKEEKEMGSGFRGTYANPMVSIDGGPFMPLGIAFATPPSEKSYADKRRERRAKVLGLIKTEKEVNK